MKRQLIILAVEVAGLVALHFVLVYWLAEKNVVASLLAGGTHVPVSTKLLTGLFLLVRVWVVLFLPGFVLYRLVMLGRRRRD